MAARNGRHERVMDDETKAMIYQGASVSQLAQLFAMDNRTVTAKLGVLAPIAQRGGYPIFLIKEAAPYLCEPLLDMDDIDSLANYVKSLNPSNIPKMLSKEFWQSMLNRQKYEEQAGDLHRTEKVIEVFADFAKAVATPIRLAGDNVNNLVELDPRQRQVLTEFLDGLLSDIHASIEDRFAQFAPGQVINEVEEDDL